MLALRDVSIVHNIDAYLRQSREHPYRHHRNHDAQPVLVAGRMLAVYLLPARLETYSGLSVAWKYCAPAIKPLIENITHRLILVSWRPRQGIVKGKGLTQC
jgi:hypothetical protein